MLNNDTQEFWESAWARHIEQYLSAPPRTGYWIQQRLPLKGRNILEIAGGSCRDSRYLALEGINATGSDFEKKTLDYLEGRFKDSPLKLRQADGFSLPFHDDEFFATFHNGFWVLFSDADIRKLAIEQARITSRYMVVLAHNRLNARLVERFKSKAKTDDLYRIRFFTPEELVERVRDSGIRTRSVSVEKFGGVPDLLFSEKITQGSGTMQSLMGRLASRLYSVQPWNRVERIACVIELDK